MEKEKIEKANEIVKDYFKDCDESSWVYIDFVKEDRFLLEIKCEKDVDIINDTAEELAEFAIDKITSNVRISNLIGF